MKFNEIVTHLNNIPKSQDFKIYLIGGIIRDKLLGIENFEDIDIAVEGDIEKFVSYFRIYFGKKIIKENRSKLKTYKFILDDSSFDIIFTRKELYVENGMLPELSRGDIYDDIKRRDFTINSIAYSLQENNYIDPLNGIKDLEDRMIRENRKNLFLEDPTRIFRFFKYKERLNFSGEENTLADLKRSLSEKEIFKNVSKSRISREWFLILKEKERKRIIDDLHKENLFLNIFKKEIKLNLNFKEIENEFLYTLGIFFENDSETLIDILDILLNGIKDKEKEEVINIKEKKNLTERVKKKYSYILEVY
uniref:CCA tRNA nucleotidyltransferase n=1 Tax=candidate division WOR-3 bacterium TaxID=2052148 RepID=A0A7C3N5A5_UNCW3